MKIVQYAAFPLLFLSSLPLLVAATSSGSGSSSSYTTHSLYNGSNNSNNRCNVQISPRAIVSDACASYSTLERLNTQVKPAIEDLTHNTDFFSHYRVNLFHKSCPFWNDEDGMCGNIGCAVQTLDNEEDIPEVWRAHELGKLEGPHAKHPARKIQKEKPRRPLQGELGDDVGESCVVEYDDECDERDYCVPEDESALSKGDYVSLAANPERFTGYSGDGAKQVWDAIYRENCFQKSSFPHAGSSPGLSSAPGAGMGALSSEHANNPAQFDFKSVLDNAGRQHVLELKRQNNPNTPFVAQTGFEVDDECLEKRVFYKVMSGMHASISTHLCWDFLNQTTGEWTPNVRCYEFRLHKFPDRISNLYFNYALLTRAIAKLKPQLESGEYVFCTGDLDQDSETRAKVLAVTEAASSVPEIFDESLMFQNGEGPSLREDFRTRFRNVSRLMDCVGCDKCRLWGKLQTVGYGTALKVLFESENESAEVPHLKRTELVALFNTYSRLASSLNAITKFRVMIEEENEEKLKKEQMEEAKEEEKEEEEEKKTETATTWKMPDRANKVHNVVVVDSDKAKDDDESSATASPAAETNPGSKEQHTIMEILYMECEIFWKVTQYVVKSWLRMPVNLYHITISELVRTWQLYAGQQVNERVWDWDHGVHVDEL